MGYMLIGTFLVAGSMGALELDQIGYVQFCVQALIGLAISIMVTKRIWRKLMLKSAKMSRTSQE